MLTRAHLILLVLMIAAPAHAKLVEHAARVAEDSPAIVVARPDNALAKIERSAVDARDVGDTTIVTMTIELGCPGNFNTARMTITLPRDAAVVGMTFARAGERLTAAARDARDAVETFEQVRQIKRDPALLEWTDAAELRLSLYPLMEDEHPTATVTIAMPRFRRLTVDVAGTDHTLIGGTFAAPGEAEIAAAHREPAVTSGMSLLAMPPPSFDDIDVQVEKSMTALRGCHVREEDETGPDVVTLTLVIDAGGHVAEASAGDSMFGACAARVASAWRFGSSDRPVAMHYRLHVAPEPLTRRRA